MSDVQMVALALLMVVGVVAALAVGPWIDYRRIARWWVPVIVETLWSFRHPGAWFRQADWAERATFIGGVLAMVAGFLYVVN